MHFRASAFLATLLLSVSLSRAGLVWDKPVRQFQRAPADVALEAHFTFKNTGPAPVTIKTLRSSCGCTTARLNKKTYAPGESGEVVTRFLFGDRRGLHRKTIEVRTDDAAAAPVVLDLRVLIHDPLTVTPALVWWKRGDATGAKTVQLTAVAEQSVRIKSVTSSNPRLPAKLVTIKPGEQYTVSVQPVDTTQKEAAEISVLTDFPPDAPRSYIIHARVK